MARKKVYSKQAIIAIKRTTSNELVFGKFVAWVMDSDTHTSLKMIEHDTNKTLYIPTEEIEESYLGVPDVIPPVLEENED